MGLYLCVFERDVEVDGVEIGSYADFGHFRHIVTDRLEGGAPGSNCPTLIFHSDCDGEWSVKQCIELEMEVRFISAKFKNLPPAEFNSDWQRTVAKSLGLRPKNLYESFIDVDGEPLLERLLGLCKLARERDRPILFQ